MHLVSRVCLEAVAVAGEILRNSQKIGRIYWVGRRLSTVGIITNALYVISITRREYDYSNWRILFVVQVARGICETLEPQWGPLYAAAGSGSE